MGISKKMGKIATFALALTLVASFGVVSFPAKAEAAKKLVWATKFVCHTTHIPSEIQANTVINVINPTEDPVELNKKVVYSFRESLGIVAGILEGEETCDGFCVEGDGASGLIGLNIGDHFGETLGPNDSFFVDCPEIFRLLNNIKDIRSTLDGIFNNNSDSVYTWPAFEFNDTAAAPPLYVDGFFVIEVAKTGRNNAKTKRPLIVTAHHWISTFGIIDREIVPTDPVKVRGQFKLASPMTAEDIPDEVICELIGC